MFRDERELLNINSCFASHSVQWLPQWSTAISTMKAQSHTWKINWPRKRYVYQSTKAFVLLKIETWVLNFLPPATTSRDPLYSCSITNRLLIISPSRTLGLPGRYLGLIIIIIIHFLHKAHYIKLIISMCYIAQDQRAENTKRKLKHNKVSSFT